MLGVGISDGRGFAFVGRKSGFAMTLEMKREVDRLSISARDGLEMDPQDGRFTHYVLVAAPRSK